MNECFRAFSIIQKYFKILEIIQDLKIVKIEFKNQHTEMIFLDK